MITERKILWTVTDPRGLTITLTDDVWQSHLPYRPELASHFDQIRPTAQDPDAIYFDPDSTVAKTPSTKVYWYYKSEPLIGKFAKHWIAVVVKVVVESSNTRQGYVETAMLPRRVLKRLVLEWKR